MTRRRADNDMDHAPHEHRIFVFGGPCSGKTTFTKQLADRLQIRSLHLDDHFWYGNWQNVGREELLRLVREIVDEEPEWVIEGSYRVVRDSVWSHCTRLYYCHAPLIELVRRAMVRALDPCRTGVPLQVRNCTGAHEHFRGLLSMLARYHMTRRRSDIEFCIKVRELGIDVRFLECNEDSITREIASLPKHRYGAAGTRTTLDEADRADAD